MADESSQNEFDTMSVSEFSNKLATDAALNARYLANPGAPEFTKFTEAVGTLYQKYGSEWDKHLDDASVAGNSVPQGQVPAGTPQGSAESAVDVGSVGDDSEIEVKVRVPKNLFGSYLTGRTPDQAILEALKGNQQKDVTIKVLKEQSLATHDENLSLRSRVKKAIEQEAKPQLPALPQEVLEAASTDVDNADFLDPDDAERVRRSTKAMAAFVKNIQPAQQVGEKADKAKAEIAKLDEETEFAEIRQLQLEDPSLMTTMDFKTLDKSVSAFLTGISRMSGGLSGADAWALYNDPQRGEQFKAQCAAAGVVMPAEINQHMRIMEARSKILPVINEERSKEAQKLTNVLRAKGKLSANETVDINEVERPSYATIWRRIAAATQAAPGAVPPVVQPAQPVPAINPALQQQIEARRAQTESQTVPLIPPGASVAEVDPSQISLDMFMDLDDKFRKNPGMITRDEAVILKKGYDFAKVPIPPELKSKLQ